MNSRTLSLSDVDVILLDFDGVLTDNMVYLNQNGNEHVRCSRADGLAFDILRKLKKPVYILSTERNPVVTARGDKLRVPVIQGVENKIDGIRQLVMQHNFDLKKALYLGNDLNDYHVMQLCGFSVSPSDAHMKIKEISTIILETSGGNGVIRELLEDVFQLDFMKILYSSKEAK